MTTLKTKNFILIINYIRNKVLKLKVIEVKDAAINIWHIRRIEIRNEDI